MGFYSSLNVNTIILIQMIAGKQLEFISWLFSWQKSWFSNNWIQLRVLRNENTTELASNPCHELQAHADKEDDLCLVSKSLQEKVKSSIASIELIEEEKLSRTSRVVTVRLILDQRMCILQLIRMIIDYLQLYKIIS